MAESNNPFAFLEWEEEADVIIEAAKAKASLVVDAKEEIPNQKASNKERRSQIVIRKEKPQGAEQVNGSVENNRLDNPSDKHRRFAARNSSRGGYYRHQGDNGTSRSYRADGGYYIGNQGRHRFIAVYNGIASQQSEKPSHHISLEPDEDGWKVVRRKGSQRGRYSAVANVGLVSGSSSQNSKKIEASSITASELNKSSIATEVPNIVVAGSDVPNAVESADMSETAEASVDSENKSNSTECASADGVKDRKEKSENDGPEKAKKKKMKRRKETKNDKAEDSTPAYDENKNMMTLEEYEKVRVEERKALDSLVRKDERKVNLDKDFESMHLVGKKDDLPLTKDPSEDKLKKEDSLETKEKTKKVHTVTINIDEFHRRPALSQVSKMNKERYDERTSNGRGGRIPNGNGNTGRDEGTRVYNGSHGRGGPNGGRGHTGPNDGTRTLNGRSGHIPNSNGGRGRGGPNGDRGNIGPNDGSRFYGGRRGHGREGPNGGRGGGHSTMEEPNGGHGRARDMEGPNGNGGRGVGRGVEGPNNSQKPNRNEDHRCPPRPPSPPPPPNFKDVQQFPALRN